MQSLTSIGDFWPVSKNNTGSLPLRGILPVTKASSHEGQCIPAGYCHTNAHYAGGVNNYLKSNHTKYLAQLCGRFFCVFENFRRKFANLVAPPTNGTTKRLVRC